MNWRCHLSKTSVKCCKITFHYSFMYLSNAIFIKLIHSTTFLLFFFFSEDLAYNMNAESTSPSSTTTIQAYSDTLKAKEISLTNHTTLTRPLWYGHLAIPSVLGINFIIASEHTPAVALYLYLYVCILKSIPAGGFASGEAISICCAASALYIRVASCQWHLPSI